MEQNNRLGEKQCPWCGETVLAAALKCRHCGEFFGQTRPKTPAGSIYKLMVTVLAVVVVIVGTVAYNKASERAEQRAKDRLIEMQGYSDEELCEIAGHPAEYCPPP